MKAELHHSIQGIPAINRYDLDELLEIFADSNPFVVEDQTTKDWIEGYALVAGKRIQVLLPEDDYPKEQPVLRVTFPTLDLSLL